jgi:hypothetical protein
MCRVLNKHAAGKHHGAIYIGRGSKWGNPFRIGADGDRAAVIAKHARWLRDQHHLLRALDELRGKDLLCFCAPAAPRRSAAAARQRVTGGPHRVVALGRMTAVHTSRSRGPARRPGGAPIARRRGSSRCAAPIRLGRPGRATSSRPFSPCRANRVRQCDTVCTETLSVCEIAVVDCPAWHISAMRARTTWRCSAVPRRVNSSRELRSSRDSLIACACRPLLM